MAEKHKSKYKSPKDLEKSQKPKLRKDLKDYTMDDKDGGLNPKSTKEKQLNVLRKTDKEVVDNGDLNVKYNADDRLYKDLEDGVWEPKDAAKKLKKRQDSEEKEIKDVIKDKIENLTREQKERMVREYIRKKIEHVLIEQTTTPPAEEEPVETPPAEEPTTTEPTAEPATPPATPTPTDTATPPAETPATDTTTTPATTEPSAETESPESEEQESDRTIRNATSMLEKEGSIGIIKTISRMLNPILSNREVEDQQNILRMLRTYAIKKLGTVGRESKENKSPETK
jgi:hypothetical protein